MMCDNQTANAQEKIKLPLFLLYPSIEGNVTKGGGETRKVETTLFKILNYTTIKIRAYKTSFPVNTRR